MKLIELTKGKTAKVDDEDYEKLMKYSWNAHKHSNSDTIYYASRGVKVLGIKKVIGFKMHRQIMGVIDPKISVDHINGDSLDNRRCNLRVCAHKENTRNRKKSENKSSPYKGLWWNKRSKKWQAAIRFEGKAYHLRYFIDPIEAAEAYNKAAIKYFGEYAKLNIINKETKCLDGLKNYFSPHCIIIQLALTQGLSLILQHMKAHLQFQESTKE